MGGRLRLEWVAVFIGMRRGGPVIVSANRTGKKAAKTPSVKKTVAAAKPPVKAPPKTDAVALSHLVVGIGASAGGLDALKAFFSALPADNGMSFVVIQHLDPERESLMASLLGATTAMEVVQIKRRTRLEANHVYVTPPKKYVSIKNGYLSLTKPVEQRGSQMAVDFFFRALARDQFERAAGIVLSGTGSDGSAGIRAIKENGGLSLVQEPETAAYDGMPRNAINTGMADYVLAIDKMPKVLLRYAGHPYVMGSADGVSTEGAKPDHLTDILALLRTRLKRDFRYYKKSTLMRRASRRMGVVHVGDMAAYLVLLRKNPAELNNLFKDLLIGVTQFFRDAEAFEALAKTVIPMIVKNQTSGQPIRVWVPGCASGEEAYSLAMIFIEHLSAKGKSINLQIFATDIDADALEVARNGIFPESIVADVSPKRLGRIFIKDGDRYRAIKQLRECIAFADQNLISDPPFSKLDLVSCRNLLIYIEPELQAKIISLFHYTLNEGGYLFLGSSETVGRQSNLFTAKDKKAKIFQRRPHAMKQQVDFPLVAMDDHKERPALQPAQIHPRRIVYADLTHRLLSEVYAPASVLINRDGEALYLFGPTDRYLKLPSGEPHLNLVAMARDGLKTKLRGLIQRVVRKGKAETLDSIQVRRGDDYFEASVSVSPIDEPRQADGLFLVAFSERKEASPLKTKRRKAPDDESAVINELERELQSTREDLQSTIEEMETSNEELKASNEEAMSMNEELEISKEEMQSLNEELNTVNVELNDKVEQLEASRNDIANLLANTDIATVFLNPEMLIKGFTPAARQLFNFQSTDSGRKLSDFTKTFMDPELLADSTRVLAKLTPITKEILSDDGSWFNRRILPYRTEDNRINGVVITFVDITDVKTAEIEANRLAAIVKDSNDAITLLDLKGKVLAWNHGAEKMYGYKQTEAIGMNIREIVPAGERKKAPNNISRMMSSVSGETLTTKRLTKDGRILDVERTTTILTNDQGKAYAIATTERDISERRKIEELRRNAHDRLEAMVEERTRELKENEALYRNLVETSPHGIHETDTRGNFLFCNRAFCKMVSRSVNELKKMNVSDLLPKEARKEFMAEIAKFATPQPGPSPYFNKITTKRGRTIDVEVRWNYKRDGRGEVVGFISIVTDISEKVRAEDARRESEVQLRLLMDSLPVLISYIDTKQRYRFNNKAYEAWFGKSREIILGQHIRKVLGDKAYKSITPYINAALSGKAVTYDAVLTPKHGGDRYVHASYVPDFSEDGTIRGFFTMMEDVTKPRRLESEQRQRQKMEALGQLAGGISHEINNLLQPILMDSTAELWSLPADSADRLKLDRISLAARNARDIVRGVLSFSRQTGGGNIYTQNRFVEAVRQGLEMVGHLLPKAIDIAHDIPDHDGLTMAHPTEIVQVLTNLLTNASDAMDHVGKITVSLKSIDVDAERGDEFRITPGPYFLLSVADKGSGMTPEIKRRSFEPFYTTKAINDGTGLGLSIVYGIVRSWGGAVHIDSEAGIGSRIDIYVPKIVRESSNNLKG